MRQTKVAVTIRLGALPLLALLPGCGAATDVFAEEGGDGADCPGPRDDSTASASCGGSAVCEGVALSMPTGSAHGEGGGPLQAGVMVFNCGSEEAPPCIEVVLRTRHADGGSEIVGRGWTSVALPFGLGEQVPVEAPWESWQEYIDDPLGFCVEAVLDPEGRIAKCGAGGDVADSLPMLGGACPDGT